MIRLSSYVQDQWVEGTGEQSVLVNPSTEEALAETSTSGHRYGGRHRPHGTSADLPSAR